MGLRKGEAPRYTEELGDGLRTGEAVPLGLEDPSLRIIVEEIVFLAACLARSVLTKLVTSSSRLPLRFGEASNSRGPTSVLTDDCGEEVMCVMLDPLAGDSLDDGGGEENDEFLDEEAEFLPGTKPGWPLLLVTELLKAPCLSRLLVEKLVGTLLVLRFCLSRLP
jgi:hypothetical protein